MWLLFALLSAVFAAFRRKSERQLSHKLNHFNMGWTVQLSALPVIFIALLLGGTIFNPLHLSVSFWIPTILVWFGFYPLNTFLYVSALRRKKQSKVVPLQSLGPVLALFMGWLTLGQKPSMLAAFGIMITVIGIYLLNSTKNPFEVFIKEKASRYTLISMLLFTLVGILDVIAIRASEPIFYTFVSTLGAVPVLYASARVSKVKESSAILKHKKQLLITGALFGLSYTTYCVALKLGPLAYVHAARGGSLMLVSLIGVFYKNEEFTKRKVMSLAMVCIGMVLTSLG